MGKQYSRILLKISGEALANNLGFGIDENFVENLCDELIAVNNLGISLAIVVGGGNFFRGIAGAANGMNRPTADNVGMLSTVMNAITLQSILEKKGSPSRVMSAITMTEIAESYTVRKALHHLNKNRIVICAAGTGLPYFTTDTTAVLRGLELQTDIILKATKVDGVFDSDPKKNPDAKLYNSLSFMEVLQKRLQIMDAAAISLCMDNNMPIRIFNLFETGNIERVAKGEPIGTHVYGG